MITLFLERNLNQTLSFLCKIGLNQECSIFLDPLELASIANQNTKNFSSAYSVLLCQQSICHLKMAVFCTCCSSRKIFLRNFSLLLENHPVDLIKFEGYKNDPFLKFIESSIEKDKSKSIELLLEVINEIPLFWDAYLLLADLTDSFIFLQTELAPYFYAHLKIQKDLDPPTLNLNFKSNSFDLKNLPYNVEILDLNYKAALNYCYGNQDISLDLFKQIDGFNNSYSVGNIKMNVQFFEFFGMLLYNTNDSSLRNICESMNNFFKFHAETYVMVGLMRLSTGNFSEAVNLFTRALKKKNSADIRCLLAYSYIKMNEYGQAVASYQDAIKLSPKNFRIFYSAAQGFFTMNKLEVSLWYCKNALDIRSNGSIYKLMGRIYMALNNLDVAMQYFENSLMHEEVDSLLYMADAYRKKNEMKKALELYERYAEKGQRNIKVVVKYLVDYYEEHGNEEKTRYYREKYKQILTI